MESRVSGTIVCTIASVGKDSLMFISNCLDGLLKNYDSKIRVCILITDVEWPLGSVITIQT